MLKLGDSSLHRLRLRPRFLFCRASATSVLQTCLAQFAELLYPSKHLLVTDAILECCLSVVAPGFQAFFHDLYPLILCFVPRCTHAASSTRSFEVFTAIIHF